MLRNWGGIVDVTPDRSPIIGLTPVPGLFVNCGWGTGGFKATPGSGHVFAATIARGEPHPIAAPFTLDRFVTGRLIDEAAAAAVAALMLLIPARGAAQGRRIEFRYGGEAHIARPADPAPWPMRRGPISFTCAAIPRARTPNAGGICHGCGRFFNCVRDTVSDRIITTYPRPGNHGPAMSTSRSAPRPAAASGATGRSRFSFDGRRLRGCAGDTLASALLANGVHLLGRSFKYHRPRGILSAGSEEPNALVTVNRGAGPRHTQPARDADRAVRRAAGHAARIAGRRSASISARSNDALSPLFAAGFSYKTFMWPRAFWQRLYEPAIRAAAGLGRAPTNPIPIATSTTTRIATCW